MNSYSMFYGHMLTFIVVVFYSIHIVLNFWFYMSVSLCLFHFYFNHFSALS